MSRNAEVSIILRARDFASKTLGRVKTEMSALKSTFFSLKTAAIAFGLAIAVHVGKRLFELGADVEETRNKFVTVFGDMTDKMDEFVNEFGTMSGIAREQMEDMVAGLGAIAQGMGFTREASADFSKQVFKTAADLASFNNVPTSQALEDIRSALARMPRPIRKYGIMLSQAKIQQEALRESGKASADALTEQETALATLTLIRRQAGVQIGDNVRTQDSAQRSYRSLGAAVTNIHQSLGVVVKTLVSSNSKLLTARDSVESLDEKISKNIATITAWANVILQLGKFVGVTFFQMGKIVFHTGEMMIDGLVATFSKVGALFTQYVVNPIISGLNGLIDKVNKIPHVNIPKLESFSQSAIADMNANASAGLELLQQHAEGARESLVSMKNAAVDVGDAVATAQINPGAFAPGTTASLPGNVQTPGGGIEGVQAKIQEESKKLQQNLAGVQQQADLLGPSFDRASAEVNVLGKAIEKFANLGADANTVVGVQGETLGQLVERYRALQEQLRVTEQRQAAVKSMLQQADQIMQRHPGIAGYTGAVMRLNELLRRGLIDQRAYNLELKDLRTQFASSAENATTFGEKIGAALAEATSNARTMQQVMADMITGTIRDFGDAIAGAFEAFVTGSKSAGQAFIGAMIGAVATVARKMGEYFIAQGLAALGLALLPPPLGTPTGFAAAAKLFAAGAAMFAISGALGGVAAGVGGGGGGGGGASDATSTSAQQEQFAKEKAATIVIEGGLLDMSDPRQADALAKAVEDLADRRVTVKGG